METLFLHEAVPGHHAKGWSREQAIDDMLVNSPMSRTDVTAEASAISQSADRRLPTRSAS